MLRGGGAKGRIVEQRSMSCILVTANEDSTASTPGLPVSSLETLPVAPLESFCFGCKFQSMKTPHIHEDLKKYDI